MATDPYQQFADIVPLIAADQQKLDQWINGGEAETVDTDAGPIPTWAGLIAQLNADAAATEVGQDRTAAEQAAADAQDYRDAAAVAGVVYADAAAGLAATSDSEYFKAVSTVGGGFLDLFLNDGGAATLIDTFPSLGGLDARIAAENELTTRLNRSFSDRLYNGESLRADFQARAYGLGDTTGISKAVAENAMFSVSRSSPKWVWQPVSGGVIDLVEVPPDTLAHEWDPASGEYLGVLIEEARTNLFLNSDAPATQTITVTDGATYTVSVIGSGSADFSDAGTGSATQGSPVTITASGTSLTVTVTGSVDYCQVEEGAFATSMIMTAGSPAPRAADDTARDLGTEYRAGTGTLIVEFAYLGLPSSTAAVASMNDGTTSNRFLEFSITGTGNLQVVSTGVGSDVLALAPSTYYSVAVSCDGTNLVWAADGVYQDTISGDSTATGVNKLELGILGGSDSRRLTCWIRRLIYVPFALSAAELEAHTSS